MDVKERQVASSEQETVLRDLAQPTARPQEGEELPEGGACSSVAVLLEEGYLGFNFVSYDGHVYAIAQEAGLVDVPRLTLEGIAELARGSHLIVTSSLETAKSRVEAIPRVPRPTVKVLEEGYRRFNIIAHGSRVYAVAQDVGQIDFSSLTLEGIVELANASRLLLTDSLEAAKARIDAASRRPRVAKLVEEGFLGFNIVAYEGRVYALAQQLGQIDVAQLSQTAIAHLENQLDLFVADSVETLKAQLAALKDLVPSAPTDAEVRPWWPSHRP